MLYSRSILLFLACLLACVSAAPLHHRRSCKHSVPAQFQDPAPAAPSTSAKPKPNTPEKPQTPSKPSKPSTPEEDPEDPEDPEDDPEDPEDPEEEDPEDPEEEDPEDPEEPENETPQTGLMGKLLPVSKSLVSWTTASEGKNKVDLSDKTLRPHNAMSSLSRDYVNFAGKRAIHAHFSKGSYAYRGPPGGLSFYAPGPASLDLTKAKEAWFGYSVYFPKGFNFVLGGKLFGLYGGNSDSEAVGCSGGRRSAACFSARLMWRTEGQGEFYTYLPPYTESRFSANKVQCNYPNSDCNPTYGASIGRGSFHFKEGAWTTVSQRVRLNDVGKANGELELFADGKSVIKLGGLILRDSNNGRIRGVQAQTFFGGSKTQFQAKKDEDAYFADFTMAITEYL